MALQYHFSSDASKMTHQPSWQRRYIHQIVEQGGSSKIAHVYVGANTIVANIRQWRYEVDILKRYLVWWLVIGSQTMQVRNADAFMKLYASMQRYWWVFMMMLCRSILRSSRGRPLASTDSENADIEPKLRPDKGSNVTATTGTAPEADRVSYQVANNAMIVTLSPFIRRFRCH